MEALPVIGGELRRYSVESFLAAGGMGALYIGKQFGAAGFEKTVVLKQLRAELVGSAEGRARFIREAKISASLDHVNVVRTLDLVRLGRSYFIVMEHVDGVDLRLFTRRLRLLRRRFDAAPALHVGLEVLEGLVYAHRLGVVHRDISPSNILLSRDGDVKLSDFGIATLSSPLEWALQHGQPTGAGRAERVEGKPGYMAPEQHSRGGSDPRADLFSVAVCLYEALAGERLFPEQTLLPSEELHRKPPPPIWNKRPDLPLRDLDEVLRTALAPDPARRFSSAESFSGALREVVRRWRLGLSTAAFARHLRAAAGPPESWREQPPLLGQDTSTRPIGIEPAAARGPFGRVTSGRTPAASPRT